MSATFDARSRGFLRPTESTSTRQLSSRSGARIAACAAADSAADCTPSASSCQRSSAPAAAFEGSMDGAGAKLAIAHTSKAPRHVERREATAAATSAVGPISPPADATSGCIVSYLGGPRSTLTRASCIARSSPASPLACACLGWAGCGEVSSTAGSLHSRSASTPSVSAAERNSASRKAPDTPLNRKRNRGQAPPEVPARPGSRATYRRPSRIVPTRGSAGRSCGSTAAQNEGGSSDSEPATAPPSGALPRSCSRAASYSSRFFTTIRAGARRSLSCASKGATTSDARSPLISTNTTLACSDAATSIR
eukprot:7389550-Prymnesium_polylepis.2